MTDAEKREKAIRGLEAHANPKTCETCAGEYCPYYDRDGSYTAVTCSSFLAADALALLKEQEAIEPKIVRSEDFLWSQWYVCGACEYPVNPGDRFCPKCGRPIKWEGDNDAD